MPTTSTLISVRLSAEALAAIDAAPGRNRTDKLEALVLLRSMELPDTLAALEAARRELTEARQALAGVRRAQAALERLEALAAHAADEARAPEARPLRLIDLPDPMEPMRACEAYADMIADRLAAIEDGSAAMMQPKRGRPHRRPPARRKFRHNHQPSGAIFV